MLAQRFILAVLCGALLELSAIAVAGIFAPGIQGYALVGCALGLLLAVAWIWEGLGLMVAGGTLAMLAGWAASHWAEAQDVTSHQSVFVTSEISRGIDPRTVFFVVAGTV